MCSSARTTCGWICSTRDHLVFSLRQTKALIGIEQATQGLEDPVPPVVRSHAVYTGDHPPKLRHHCAFGQKRRTLKFSEDCFMTSRGRVSESSSSTQRGIAEVQSASARSRQTHASYGNEGIVFSLSIECYIRRRARPCFNYIANALRRGLTLPCLHSHYSVEVD